MLKLSRLAVLLIVSVLITALLYWADSDAPSDTIYQMALNALVVFAVITLMYSGVYKLRKG